MCLVSSSVFLWAFFCFKLCVCVCIVAAAAKVLLLRVVLIENSKKHHVCVCIFKLDYLRIDECDRFCDD